MTAYTHSIDALGRRIAKAVRSGRTDEETVRYFHHDWQVIEEHGFSDKYIRCA